MKKISLRYYDPRPGHESNQCVIDDVSNWDSDEILALSKVEDSQDRTEHEFIIEND
jgi:predicted hotdog family 3-hydroxylacyl-ACP dehydratase